MDAKNRLINTDTLESSTPRLGRRSLYPRFVRYDLSKLRAKHPRRYRLLLNGYSICLVFLKLFERVYAQAAAGFLSPIKAHASLHSQHRSQLDRLYQRVVDDIDKLIQAVGLKAA